jgi:hypothetical protein
MQYNFLQRLKGALLANREVLEDIRLNKPVKQAIALFLIFTIANLLLVMLAIELYFSSVFAGVDLSYFSFFGIFSSFILIFILLLAIVWLAFNYLVYPFYRRGDADASSPFCLSAFFYPTFSLFFLIPLLFSLTYRIIASWYYSVFFILLLAIALYFVIMLARFIKNAYVVGTVGGIIASLLYVLASIGIAFLIGKYTSLMVLW